MIVHVVLFKLRHPEHVPETVGVLESMEGQIETLQHLEVGVDQVKSDRSYDIALTTRFKSWDDLETYRRHPFHQGVLTHMASVTERSAVVDYEV